MRFNARLLLLIAPVILSACGAASTPAPESTDVRIGTTPAFTRQATAWVKSYNEEHPTESVSVVTIAPSEVEAALNEERVEVVIFGGAPENGWFATPLLPDGIALVVHPSVRVRDYELSELRSLFSGSIQNWESLGGEDLPIELAIPLPADEVREAFTEQVMAGGHYASSAFLGPNPEAIQTLVKETDGAIGFLPFSSLTENLGITSIEGARPSMSNIRSGSYPLRIEIIAVSLEEPEGNARVLLTWIQSLDE